MLNLSYNIYNWTKAKFGTKTCTCLDTSRRRFAPPRQVHVLTKTLLLEKNKPYLFPLKTLENKNTCKKVKEANAGEWIWRTDPLAPNNHLTPCVFLLYFTTYKQVFYFLSS